jgi:hypothetical protein
MISPADFRWADPLHTVLNGKLWNASSPFPFTEQPRGVFSGEQIESADGSAFLESSP